MKNKLALFIFLVLGLTACGSRAEPRLIGYYPSAERAANQVVVYTVWMELEVRDPAAAAEKASQMAYDSGGYLSASQSWYQGDDPYITLELAVPTPRVDELRRKLAGLGDLLSERVAGELSSAPPGRTPFSTIHVQLRQGGFSLPDFPTPRWPLPDWRPLRTLAQAWQVFLAIFGFLVDVLIWLLVVPGPFVLLAWVAVRLWRRRQRRSLTPPPLPAAPPASPPTPPEPPAPPEPTAPPESPAAD